MIDAFGILDEQGRGYIVPTDLREALLDLGMRVNIDEAHLIFDKFKLAEEGKLKYSEFADAMMPLDQTYVRGLGNKKLTYNSKQGR